MSRFLVSRTAAGYCFLLESESGRTLVSSKDYATLDACKKGICALVYYAPIVPVIDTAAGERAPNPKFELIKEAQSYRYVLKSANGKSVIVSAPLGSRKACLRALSMLRAGVQGAQVLFSRPAGLTPLVVGGMVCDPVPVQPVAKPIAQEEAAAPVLFEDAPTAIDALDMPDAVDVSDWSEEDVPDEVVGMADESRIPSVESVPPPAVKPTPPAPVKQPRRVKLQEGDPAAHHVTTARATKKPTPPPLKKPSGVLSRLFKR